MKPLSVRQVKRFHDTFSRNVWDVTLAGDQTLQGLHDDPACWIEVQRIQPVRVMDQINIIVAGNGERTIHLGYVVVKAESGRVHLDPRPMKVVVIPESGLFETEQWRVVPSNINGAEFDIEQKRSGTRKGPFTTASEAEKACLAQMPRRVA